MSQQKDLERLENDRRRKLELLLLGILLSVSSEQELLLKIKQLPKDVIQEIIDMRKASFEVADEYSNEVHRVNDKDRKLIIASAALYTVSMIVRRVSVSNKASYVEKAVEAVNESKPTINRLVNTEVYEANMKKMVANNKNQMLRWVAINDKRTCAQCSALDGKEYRAEDVPDYVHIGCRCFCEVID